ncbi:MAG: type I-E CRISPR-associated protein Cas6/Cse3/CasE [Magnetococcales bacterium]|nr:type I-E CRISPR-associated protein Cas6/Cse3/CasE [Magnetococcales bacterium]
MDERRSSTMRGMTTESGRQWWFSRIEWRPEPGKNGGVARLCQDGYQRHQLIWRLFPGREATEREFLYRAIDEGGVPGYYVVSSIPPQDSEGVWRIHSKPYAPQLMTGERLRFSLRANPVVTRKNVRTGKNSRHDVVMDAKKRSNDVADMQHVGAEWLRERAGHYGFEVDQVAVDGYRQHRFQAGRKAHQVRFSSLDFDGWLIVTNPESLVTALMHGIGPAKGFGCGLLMVRRGG